MFERTGNPFSRTTTSELTLLYGGKPVVVQTTAGNYRDFYQAWVLQGAPKLAQLPRIGWLTEARTDMLAYSLGPVTTQLQGVFMQCLAR